MNEGVQAKNWEQNGRELLQCRRVQALFDLLSFFKTTACDADAET